LPSQNHEPLPEKETKPPVCPYQELPEVAISSLLAEFETEIENFLKMGLEYDGKVKYSVCVLDLIDAIIRVDKRMHYFRVFHGMDCNEVKKAALYAYWIARLHPIKITDPKYIDKEGYNNKVNEQFAVHHMLSAIVMMGRLKLEYDSNGYNPDGVYLEPKNPYYERLVYSMRFRNITIDSIIVFADAITTDSFKRSEKEVLP